MESDLHDLLMASEGKPFDVFGRKYILCKGKCEKW
jgi:hypothetical protein